MKLLNNNPFIEESFDAIFVLSSELNILQWNQAMEALTGIPSYNTLGKPIFETIPSLEKECSYYFNTAIKKESRKIELQNLSFHKPISKKTVTVRARFFPIKEEDQVLIGGIFHLVANHLENQDPFTNLLKSVVMNTNDAVLITRPEPIDNPDGPIIIYANPAFTEMTGYSQEEVLGKTPRILQGEKTDPTQKKKIRTALENWDKINCELLNYTKDGESFYVDLGIVPVKNEEGYFTHWIAIQRDVTDRRNTLLELQQLNNKLEKKVAERTKELENFNYFLAHDLNRPTRTIASFIDLIERQNLSLDDQSLKYFNHIKEGAKSINEIVEAMLNLTVLNKKKLALKPSNFKDVIHKAQSSLKEKIQNTQTTIVVDEMPEVMLDFDLSVILSKNIIENAIKYTDHQQPKIEVSAHSIDDMVKIDFKDNGIGFKLQDKETVFELFKREDNNSHQKGFGIGLAICKSIMDKHNGKIEIISSTEKGSTISVFFQSFEKN